MAQNREIAGKPLVSLDAGKLLGLRQVAEVSGGRTGVASNSRARTSHLLSKVGSTEDVDPRAKMGRVLSKISVGETGDAPAAIEAGGSRVQMGRLLSKIGDLEDT